MSWIKNKKVSIGTIGLWVIFGITTIVMIALIIGEIFPPYDFWIPIIPIGVLLVVSFASTLVDLSSGRKKKMGIIAIWAVFGITLIVMAALMLGRVFTPDEFWIPTIPVGSLFILSVVPTILEYTAGDVKYCPKCGQLFEKKWDFCQECGTRILMKCPSCGAKIKGNPKFCVRCGINLSEVEFIQEPLHNVRFEAKGYTKSCKHCGAPAKPDAKYCVFCGASH